MNIKKILLTIIVLVILGFIVGYLMKLSSEKKDNYTHQEIDTVQEIQNENNLDIMENELDNIVNEEDSIDNELDELEEFLF